MANVKENTVSRKDQLQGYSRTYFLGKENSPLRILIFGNSITLHPNNKELSWFHNWGMAASDISKDYVHILFKKLSTALNFEPYMLISQVTDAESQLYKYDYESLNIEKAFKPDIVIFRLGDNIFPVKSNDVVYNLFDRLLEVVKKENQQVILTGSYFVNESIEPIINKYAKINHYSFIKLDDISLDEKNWGGINNYSHIGVAKHPGDRGMNIIADRIFKNIFEILKRKSSPKL